MEISGKGPPTFLDAALAADVVAETAFVSTLAVEVGATFLQTASSVQQLRLSRTLRIVHVRTSR